jgi:tetratricopeptide (TPR) repeat protein
MTPRTRLLLAGTAAFLLVLVAAYALRANRAAAPAAQADAGEVVPTGDNVDPAIHGQLMTLQKAAEDAPDDPDAHLALARFLHDAHRTTEAAEAYEAALALDPTRRQAWLDLANAHGADARWDDVVRVSEGMLEHFPGDPSADYNAAAAHANAGRTAQARTLWARVAQGTDAALATQAAESMARLDELAAAPPPAAPPLPEGADAGPLPAGHPPLPAAGAPRTAGGVETRVVTGGSAPADPARVRALISQ